jgi:hypothetical protein
MSAGMLLPVGGVVDDRSNWLPGGDGTPLIAIGATSFLLELLWVAVMKKPKEEDDDNMSCIVYRIARNANEQLLQVRGALDFRP